MSDVAALRPRPPRAAYALPTLFTAGNIFLGFLAMLKCIQAVMSMGGELRVTADFFADAAKCIGAAMLLDGLDGRIARLTNTTSEFGKEMDSLSDVISFGIAPAVLGYTWGVLWVPHFDLSDQLHRAGTALAFCFLICGAARLARFNVQKNPRPTNPGRPHRKYFVGLPIPAAAALIAAVIYASGGYPIQDWFLALPWLLLLGILSFLMVCTWRYYAFKDNSFLRPRSPLTIIPLGVLIFLIWQWGAPVLLSIAVCYAFSGPMIRLGGILRRRFGRVRSQSHPAENPVV